MANPNAIVGTVVRIEPPVRGTGDEMFRQHPDGFEVTFEGDRTARLLPADDAPSNLEILDELRQLGLPAYVEVDPDSQAITRLLIAQVMRVSRIGSGDGETVDVELAPSHARHRLDRSNPDFDELLGALRAAEDGAAELVVTETLDHEIIDIRERPGKALRPQPERPSLVEKITALLKRLLWWILWWFFCPSRRRAKQLFDSVAATSCAPLNPTAPCIPFLYPDNGCWARAHEMCRLMQAAGAKPGKVWIYGSLVVQTVNNPTCSVSWWYHVAPTLCVRRGFFKTERMVIDPSMFPGPVTVAQWAGAQTDPNPTLVHTSCKPYFRNTNATTVIYDANYTQTVIDLATYRLQLKNRSNSASGPPPYANC